jgi:hypothetical protein
MGGDQSIEGSAFERHRSILFGRRTIEGQSLDPLEKYFSFCHIGIAWIQAAQDFGISNGRRDDFTWPAQLDPSPGRIGSAFEQIDTDVRIEQESSVSHA